MPSPHDLDNSILVEKVRCWMIMKQYASNYQLCPHVRDIHSLVRHILRLLEVLLPELFYGVLGTAGDNSNLNIGRDAFIHGRASSGRIQDRSQTVLARE